MIEINKIYNEDCLETLSKISNDSVDCVITSPPYYQLRDYGWNGQWGLEKTYQEYLDKLISLMSELKRVLKPTGTMWVNLGDTYFGGSGGPSGFDRKAKDLEWYEKSERNLHTRHSKENNIPNKSLVLIPHRFAIRCIDELGLILRNDVIWAKRNGMPESVTDRFSKKHEFFFFFVKQQKYYFNLDGVRDKTKPESIERAKGIYNGSYAHTEKTGIGPKLERGNPDRFCNPLGKNPGDVSDFWDKSKSYPNRKYFFRENYFENIDSEDKAYWLGFIWADGYINKDSLEIEIHIKDKDHLVEFQEDLCDNHKLYDRERQTTHSCRLTLGSQKLVSDLVNLGYKNKLVPVNLPEQLERHFIRGLFDGDGSVGFYKGRGSQVRHWLEFLGKYDLMVWVAKRLKSIGMFDQIPKENKGTFRLSYVDDDAMLFYNYVYLDYSRCLERKKCRFPQELNYEFDFFDIPTQPSSDKHYATYNFDLIDKPIVAGCPKDGIILDPFCGTGTTIARAIQLGRNGIGIDGKQEYCEIAEKRIKQELSQLKLPI